MACFDFFWTPLAEQKIGERQIRREEVEHVICHPVIRDVSRSSDRLDAKGYTESGDWLVCVYEMIDDITACPVTAYRPEEE